MMDRGKAPPQKRGQGPIGRRLKLLPLKQREGPQTVQVSTQVGSRSADHRAMVRGRVMTMAMTATAIDGTMAAVPNYSAVQDRSGENFFGRSEGSEPRDARGGHLVGWLHEPPNARKHLCGRLPGGLHRRKLPWAPRSVADQLNVSGLPAAMTVRVA